MTPRLKRIVELLPVSDELFDVGCDHGIVGVSALLLNKTQKTVFTDVSRKSLEKARRLAESKGVLYKSEFLCGDGFCGRRAHTAVIAGMGGLEISKILGQASRLPTSLFCSLCAACPSCAKSCRKIIFFMSMKFFSTGQILLPDLRRKRL